MATANRDLVRVTARELRPEDGDGGLPGRKVVAPPRVLPSGRIEVVVQWRGTGKRETLRLDPRKEFPVMRKLVGRDKLLRYRAKSRVTGGLVEVYDTRHPDSPISKLEVGGHRWAMRCEHGTLAGRRVLGDAIDDVTDPRPWCTRCEVPAGALPLPL